MILVNILTNLSNSVVWMVSNLLLISSSSSLFCKFLGTVATVPTTIGITLTLMFHSFFQLSSKGQNIFLSVCFLLFSLSSPPERQNLQESKFPLYLSLTQSPFPSSQSFGDCTEYTNNNWYRFHFPWVFFQFSSKVYVLISFVLSLFYPVVPETAKSTIW